MILPTTFLLSGALYGTWRAFLVNCIIIGGTIGLLSLYTIAHHQPITFSSGDIGADVAVALCPITAALVGFCYERRRYASWWKSLLTLLAVAALYWTIVLGVLFILTGFSKNGGSFTYLVSLLLLVGVLWIIFVLLNALPITAIEGIVHAMLAARHKKAGRENAQ